MQAFSNKFVNEKGNIPRRGPVPKFSDLEVVALSLAAESESIDSGNWLFESKFKEYKGKIPNLISRRQFNDRRKSTAGLCEKIRRQIAMAIDGRKDFFFVDSKPVEVCQATRGKRCKMGRTGDFSQAPYFGYCAAQNTYYFGYKLHTVCGLSGVIHSYDLSKASIDDRKFMKDVKRVYHDSKMYGDKGYIGRICSLICLRNEICILTEAYYFHLQKSAYYLVKEACSQCNQHLITRQSALFYSSPASVFSLRVFICPPYTVDLGA